MPIEIARSPEELIRVSDRLRQQSIAAQRAAVRASVAFHDVVRRSLAACSADIVTRRRTTRREDYPAG